MSGAALLKLIRSGPKQKIEPEINFRTTEPPSITNHTSSGVNLVRIVTQHGQGELEALDDQIAKLQIKIDGLQRERGIVQELYDVAMKLSRR